MNNKCLFSMLLCKITRVYFLFVILFLTAPVCAGTVKRNDLNNFLIYSKILEATVVVVPSMIKYQHNINEEILLETGCMVTTSEKGKINKLLDILKISHMNSTKLINADNSSFMRWYNEPREGIYLKIKNGKDIKLLFQTNYLNEKKVKGILQYNNKLKTAYKIKSDYLLPKKVVLWLLETNEPKSNSSTIQSACRELLEKQTK